MSILKSCIFKFFNLKLCWSGPPAQTLGVPPIGCAHEAADDVGAPSDGIATKLGNEPRAPPIGAGDGVGKAGRCQSFCFDANPVVVKN